MDPQIQTKAIAAGSHAIVRSPPVELNELQWTLSNSNPVPGELITATLRRSPDAKGQINNISFCYKVTNNGAGPICVLPTIFPWLREWRVYINGQTAVELCDSKETKASVTELLLTEHGHDSKDRENAHVAETGTGILDPATGCIACDLMAPGETRMKHVSLSRLVGPTFNQLPLKSIGELRLEFKINEIATEWSDSAAAGTDISVTDLEIWTSIKHHLVGGPPSQPFSSYSMARPRYDFYTYTPSQHPFAAPDQKFTIQLSTIFPVRNNIRRISVYGVDPANPDSFRCKLSFIDCLDLIVDGSNNNCGGEEGGITTGKRNRKMHLEQVSNQYYRNQGIQVPVNSTDVGHNKTWSLDSIHASPDALYKLQQAVTQGSGQPRMNVAGISNAGNLQLEICNAAVVLPATANVVVELQYVEVRRVGTSGQVAKVVAM